MQSRGGLAEYTEINYLCKQTLNKPPIRMYRPVMPSEAEASHHPAFTLHLSQHVIAPPPALRHAGTRALSASLRRTIFFLREPIISVISDFSFVFAAIHCATGKLWL